MKIWDGAVFVKHLLYDQNYTKGFHIYYQLIYLSQSPEEPLSKISIKFPFYRKGK